MKKIRCAIYMRLLATGPGQAFTKPLREILATYFTACDASDRLRDYLVIFNEIVVASLNE